MLGICRYFCIDCSVVATVDLSAAYAPRGFPSLGKVGTQGRDVSDWNCVSHIFSHVAFKYSAILLWLLCIVQLSGGLENDLLFMICDVAHNKFGWNFIVLHSSNRMKLKIYLKIWKQFEKQEYDFSSHRKNGNEVGSLNWGSGKGVIILYSFSVILISILNLCCRRVLSLQWILVRVILFWDKKKDLK